jgi:hypothetical protein
MLHLICYLDSTTLSLFRAATVQLSTYLPCVFSLLCLACVCSLAIGLLGLVVGMVWLQP